MLGMMIEEGILHHITTIAVAVVVEIGTTTKTTDVLLQEEGVVAITTMRGDIMKTITMIKEGVEDVVLADPKPNYQRH